MSAGTSHFFHVIYRTILAVFLAAIIFLAAVFAVNAVVAVIEVLVKFLNSFDHRSDWVMWGITRAIVPNAIGIIAVRAACDRFLAGYSKRTIFLTFVLAAVPGFIMAVRSGWSHATLGTLLAAGRVMGVGEAGAPTDVLGVISSLSIIGTAFWFFWLNMPLGSDRDHSIISRY